MPEYKTRAQAQAECNRLNRNAKLLGWKKKWKVVKKVVKEGRYVIE